MIRILFFLIIISGFSSCRKTAEMNSDPYASSRKFKISVEQLPGTVTQRSGLTAVVQVFRAGSTRVLDVESVLHYDGSYSTDTFNLPEGNYVLTGFWIIEQGKVIYASPKAGSAKASLVSKTLDLNISLRNNFVQNFLTEVAVIETGDKAEDFGYVPGTFDIPEETDNELYHIKIRPVIKVGDIFYDSIPAKLTINTWFADGSELQSIRQLLPGTNEVIIHRKGIRHELILSKWNLTDTRILFPEDINEQDIYTLGGEIAAKKLKSVLTYKAVTDTYIPLSKTVYNYTSSDMLSEILTYKKRNDGTTYLDEKQKLSYDQNKISEIIHLNGENTQYATTNFQYNTEGLIQRIRHSEGDREILATANYLPLTGYSTIHKNYSLSVDYQYNYITYSENVNFSVTGGVVINEFSASSHGSSADISYGYDFNINPYAHLKLPDIKFSNFSIHNKNIQYAVYAAGNPETKPVTFSYTYDSDGYPTQQIVHYNYVLNGQPAFAVKSVFTY